MPRWDQWIFNLRSGRFRPVLIAVAFYILLIGLGAYLCLKRESGPSTEWIIEKGVIARELAAGNGFTTTIRTPYQISKLESFDDFDQNQNLADYWHAPAYPSFLAISFKTLGESGRDWLFSDPEKSPNRDFPFFRADRFWLFANFFLLLLVVFLIYQTARSLWNSSIAGLSLIAWLISLTTWNELILLNEGMFSVFWITLISLLVIHFLKNDFYEGLNYRQLALVFSLGGALGILILTRYAFALFVFPMLGLLIWHLKAHKSKSKYYQMIGVLGICLLVCMPWFLRNHAGSGNFFGYAANSISLRAGDPTAEVELLKNQFEPEGLGISARKVIHKGIEAWEDIITKDLWSSGGLLFSAFFVISMIYPFKDDLIQKIRKIIFIPILFFVLFEPFFASGVIETDNLFYFSGLTIMFGSAFALILLKSIRFKSEITPKIVLGLLLAMQSLPMVRFGLEPKRIPFHYPPYWPSVFVDVEHFHENSYDIESAIVSDIPAGFSWYSGARVWAQPYEFSDFSEIFLYQDVTVQFFSPALLDRPFLSVLKLQGRSEYKGEFIEHNWGQVYNGIVEGELPRFYPLKGLQALHHNVYVAYRTH